MLQTQYHILHVEDNDDHAFLVELGLRDHQLPLNLIRLKDGAQLIDYLLQKAPYNNQTIYPKIDILLLDLRLPKISGQDILDTINTKPEFSNLPVIILSTSKPLSHSIKKENFFYMMKSDDTEEIAIALGGLITKCLTQNI